MSRRLGETLVRNGVLSEDQYQRALTDQLVFGGTLSTSILELGLLEEDRLGRALGQALDVSYADRSMLASVPDEVIRAVPSRLAEKHRVIPVRLDGKSVHLAMIDPANLLALDEVSFVTGYRIRPWVALEVRILEMLERYYGVARSQRFLMLSEDLSSRRATGGANATQVGPAAAPMATLDSQIAPEGQHEQRGTQAMGAWKIDDVTTDKVRVQDSVSAQAAQEATISGGLRGERRAVAWNGAADDEDAETCPNRTTDPAVAPGDSFTFLAGAARRLAEAHRVDDVFATILAYAAVRLPRCMVFVPKAHDAVLWAASCRDLHDEDLLGLRVPMEESVFTLVDGREESYLGAPPRRRSILSFYERLGVRLPRTVIVMPIRVQERVAAYLYCDGAGQDVLALDMPSLQSICARAGFALQILILRNKILAE